jgi:tetratricopeptide (TPR) repeat protein
MKQALIILACFLVAASLAAQSLSELKQRGMQAFEAGQFKVAKENFELLVRANPSGDNYASLAVAEFRLGEIQDAVGHFERAIKLGYAPASVHFNLGLAYLKLHKAREGIRELKIATGLEPDNADAQYSLGVALLDARDPRSALLYLRKAVTHSPRDPALRANLVRAYFEAGEIDSAIRETDQAVAAIPRNAALEVVLARLCLAQGQKEKALTLLTDADQLMPNEPEIKLLLAQANLVADKPLEAVEELRSVSPTAGSPGEWPHLMAQALGQMGKLKEAREQVASAIEADPHNVSYQLTSAWIDQLDLRYQQSIDTLQHTRELEPKQAVIPYRIAVGYYYTQRFAQAAEQCEEAVRLAPSYHRAYFLMGISKLETHDLAGAQAALQRAIALKEADPLYHYELGETLVKAGKARAGQQELSRALELNPKFAGAYYWRARALRVEGDTAGAIRDLESAVAIDQGMILAFYDLGKLYKETGQEQKAAAILAKSEELRVKMRDEQEEIMRQVLVAPE